MNKPYIVCHMLTSIDGKVTGEFLKNLPNDTPTDVYYEINRNYKKDAFLCGRITMEESFTNKYYPDLSKFKNQKVERTDYIVNSDKEYFAIAFDRFGKLGWTAPHITDIDPGYNNAYIIEVLLEDVKDEYLAYLRSINVSYIFAGQGKMDVKLALDKLYKLFNIKYIMLEGGSVIDGAFMKEDLIDELSLVVAPVVAKTSDLPLFNEGLVSHYKLNLIKQYNDSVIWLNYKKKTNL